VNFKGKDSLALFIFKLVACFFINSFIISNSLGAYGAGALDCNSLALVTFPDIIENNRKCIQVHGAVQAECKKVLELKDKVDSLKVDRKNDTGFDIPKNFLRASKLKVKVIKERVQCKTAAGGKEVCQMAVEQWEAMLGGNPNCIAVYGAKVNATRAMYEDINFAERNALETAASMVKTVGKVLGFVLAAGAQLGLDTCKIKEFFDPCEQGEIPKPPQLCDGMDGQLLLECLDLSAGAEIASATGSRSGFGNAGFGGIPDSSGTSASANVFEGLDGAGAGGGAAANLASQGGGSSGGGSAPGLTGGGGAGGATEASGEGSDLQTSSGGFFSASGGGSGGSGGSRSGGGRGIGAYRSKFLKDKLAAAKSAKEKQALIAAFKKGTLLPKNLRGIASTGSRGLGSSNQDSFSIIRGTYNKKKKTLYRLRSK